MTFEGEIAHVTNAMSSTIRHSLADLIVAASIYLDGVVVEIYRCHLPDLERSVDVGNEKKRKCNSANFNKILVDIFGLRQ